MNDKNEATIKKFFKYKLEKSWHVRLAKYILWNIIVYKC